MTCDRQDSAQPYVAGTLSGDELEDFEVHLLTCEACREAVQLGSAVRAGFSLPRARASVRGRMLGFGVLLAAAVVLAVQLRRQDPFGELTRFSAPSFDGGAARSDADSVAVTVDRGMAAYAAGDYRTARRDLTRAVGSDSTPAVAFYLGVSHFMLGDHHAALRALASAQQPLGNPYEADARVLSAKVWLRLNRPDSAIASLGNFVTDDAVAEARVRALQDSIREARR